MSNGKLCKFHGIMKQIYSFSEAINEQTRRKYSGAARHLVSIEPIELENTPESRFICFFCVFIGSGGG